MSDFQSLTKQVNFWNNKPSELKAGDSVKGEVVLIQEARNDKSSRTATLKLESGDSIGVWLSTVIDGAFRSGVREGDTVRITYNGVKKSAKGADYHDYEVEVARKDASEA